MSQPQKRKQPAGGFNYNQKAQQQNQSQQQKQPQLTNIQPPIPLPNIKRGWEWYESVGKPRFVLSPMVGQSELAYRQLLRSHGATLTYTPMIIADEYIKDTSYRSSVFTWDQADRPLVVQLCATDPKDFITAAKLIIQAAKPDAIELNLGCPQSCAERGGYGSWMMEKLDVVQEILTKGVQQLPVAITAKIRVFSSLSETYKYVDMLSKTGISLLTVHPRQRHHREEVLSQWDVIESIRARVKVPVVLNGDIWGPMDLAMAVCLHNVDGYMCAQGALQMPAIFKTVAQFTEYNRPTKQPTGSEEKEKEEEDEKITIPQTKKPNSTSTSLNNQNSQQLVQIGKKHHPNDNNNNFSDDDDDDDDGQHTVELPDNINFISTKTGPYAQGFKNVNYFRVRKDLGVGITKQPLILSTTIQTILDDIVMNVNEKITKIYDLISEEDKDNYTTIITSYPLTQLQRRRFTSNKLHLQFVTVILHLEHHIDQVKRQLQNAVEYVRCIEKYPIFHHSVAQRHLFFILFDLLNKHIDCYDMLYVAKSSSEFKEVIHTLHKRAAVNADFMGCKPDNYFTKDKKERNRRRDGTLAPPQWPVGGGGFNVALNGQKNKDDKTKVSNKLGDMAGLCRADGRDVLEVGGKRINMSKFD